jgi:signal transduction histidine kinase
MNSSPGKNSYSQPLDVYGDPQRIAIIFNWFVGLMLLSLVAGSFILLSNHNIVEAIFVGLCTLPVLLSIYWLRRKKFEGVAVSLALIMISLLTLLAIRGEGVHNISLLGFPAILIVASLVIRKRTMVLLTLFSVGCAAWLVFGELSGAYTPKPLVHSVPGDFFSVSLILIATAVMVRLISEAMFRSNRRLQQELRERKEVERQREELIAELEAKNAELERFTYTVSHDLKSPLITINGFLGYLEQDAAAGNVQRLQDDSRRIREAVVKMQLLLNELLELSRIGHLMPPPQEVAFEDLVQDALATVRGRLDAGGVRVTVQPDLPTIYGDRQRLTEVLQNLIDNAAKFMGDQPEPQIEIGQCGEENGKPVFFVRDNGIGIDPKYHERVFGLFNKLDPSIEGTGVGLTLVKRIIETHGGRIWVESEAGKGATFYFTLAKPGASRQDVEER